MAPLRSLLLLFAFLTLATAIFPEVREGDDELTAAIKKVHQTWDATLGEIIEDEMFPEPSNEAHSRRKRSAQLPAGEAAEGFVAPNQFCDFPGYTGENCEFPICETANNDLPPAPKPPTVQGYPIDVALLANCSLSMTTILDSAMTEIYIRIESDVNSKPLFALYDKVGRVILPNSISEDTPSSYEAVFSPQTPGSYVVQARADYPNFRCHVTVRALSSLTVIGGFVPYAEQLAPERNDFPNNREAYVGESSTFVVHAYNLRSPGAIVSFSILRSYNIVSRPQKLSVRYGCGYEYYQENFICRAAVDHLYRVEGIDFYGNRFRRLGSFTCIPSISGSSLAPLPSTTPGPGPTSCDHGYLVTRPDGTRYCFCQALFTGTQCTYPLCINGGTRARVGPTSYRCRCSNGFSGLHCEDVSCPDKSQYGFGTDSTSAVFIVRAKSSLADVHKAIGDQIEKIVTALSLSDSQYLRNFGLVLFNNYSDSSYQSFTRVADLKAALYNAAQTSTSAGDCEDTVFSATSLAFSGLLVRNKSPIYVITDAYPVDDGNHETIFHQNSYWRAPIYVIFIEPPTSTGCRIDEYAVGYRQLEDMTRRWSGNVFFVPNTNIANISSLIYTHMRYTIYHSSLLYSNDATKCSNLATFQPVAIDIKITELTVVAVGKDLRLTITSPSAATTVPTFTYQLNDVYIWVKTTPEIGQYLFHVESSSPNTPCSYRIYTDQWLMAASERRYEYDIFWAFTSALTLDGPTYQPIANQSDSLVVHINNYNLTDASRVFAELTIYHQTSRGREAVFMSSGLWRDGCSYQLYFAPYTCTIADEMLYFTIYARDELGIMIQRSGVAYCSYEHPTPVPPSGCQNGGAQITFPDNSTACYCPPNWTGDKCQTKNCQNGGSVVTGGGTQRCDCPPGHSGEFCEYVSCFEEGAGEPYSPIGRDMVFVIELTFNALRSVYNLQQYFPSLYKDIIAHHSEWIRTFTLAAYNSTWAGILVVADRSNVEPFQTALNNAYNSINTPTADKACRVRVWHALDAVLNLVNPDAYINVFHVSAPEQSDLSLAQQTIRNAIANRIFVNIFYSYTQVPGGGVLSCNQTGDDYLLLENLADTNGGHAMPVHQSEFFQVYHMIPNYYLSGAVYARWYPDCAAQPQRVFFPVDSYTQSIQLNVLGYMNQIHVFRPDGSEFGDTYDILDDTDHAGWRITEIRRPCDTDWEPIGYQHCALCNFEQKTWDDARALCHRYGSFLVDELEQDKDEWMKTYGGDIEFWIGLNDKNVSNVFTWDQPDDAGAVPFNSSSYSKWGPNEPSGDPAKRCVARMKQPGDAVPYWYTRNCNETRASVCEKHKYDQDAQPNQITDDDLPAGKWYVTVSTNKPPADHAWNFTGCVVEVRMQSGIQVFPGFTLDDHSDAPDSSATSGSNQNHFVTHLYGGDGTRPAVLNYANLYNFQDLSMVQSTTYEKRLGCSYGWLSQTFECPNYDDPNNKYAVIHIGEDQFGMNFQRMSTGTCSAVLTACSNGGVLYNGTCVCTAYWKGKQCDTPNCIDGGSLDPTNTTCRCPDGFTGSSCEFDQCLPQVPVADGTFSMDAKTLAIVLEMTKPNQAAVTALTANIGTILNRVNTAHPRWLDSYVLITINSTSLMQVYSTQSAATFASMFAALPAITDSGTVCGAPLYGGITIAMNMGLFRAAGSTVFAITRSIPTDAQENYDFFMTALSDKKPQINYMVVDDREQVCGLDADNDKVKGLGVYALTSGGNTFILPSTSFIQFLTVYLPTVYTSTLLTTPTLADMTCADKRWFAQVDFRMSNVYLTVFTTNGAVGVIDPHGDTVMTEDMYNVGKTRLLTFTTFGIPGIYTVTMSSPTPCMVQVRGDSPLAVYTGFVQPGLGGNGAHQDNPKPDPVANMNNVVVLHLAGVTGALGRLTYTELYNPYDNSIFASQVYRRYNCSYEYYSRMFVCPDRAFLIMVNGIDDFGQNFRREVGVGYCPGATVPSSVGTVPTGWMTMTTMTTTPRTSPLQTTTPVPPITTTTSNSAAITTSDPLAKYRGAIGDIVFLIDVSLTMKRVTLNEIIAFMQTLMQPFSVGQSSMRVGIVTVPGDGAYPLPMAMLNSVTSTRLLNTYFSYSYPYFYDGSNGQMLYSALSMASSVNYLNEGYRNSTNNNHLIIYITGTSSFTDGDAVAKARQIRASKTYGILSVSYLGTNITASVLEDISGGPNCTYITNSLLTLHIDFLVDIREKIYNAWASTSGVYCA